LIIFYIEISKIEVWGVGACNLREKEGSRYHVIQSKLRRSLIVFNWICSLFVWLVADGWCWFVLREKYCWLVAGG
jgi:hypothetical protein